MEPTCTDTIVYSVADAHIILYAVYEGRLPMVHRRPCNDDERARIRSGAVFVWEEGSGIERWTDRKEWGDSRSREDFLFYTEGTKTSIKPPGTDVHGPSGLGNSAWSGPSSSMADPLVKQTYTALVKRNGADRKWHLIAYFTEGTKHLLRTVSEDPTLARLRVPPGLFSQARLPKSRRVRDRPWNGNAAAAGPASGAPRDKESGSRRRARGSSSSVATSPLAMTGAGSSAMPLEITSPVIPTSATTHTPMEDVTPTGYHSPIAYTSSYAPADAESLSYAYASSYSSRHNIASTSSAPAVSGYNSPYASPPPHHGSSSPAFTAYSSTEALPALAPLSSALAGASSSALANALGSPAPRVDEPPPPVSQIRAKEVVKLTPLDRTTHGGFAPRHPIDMRALHRLQVAC